MVWTGPLHWPLCDARGPHLVQHQDYHQDPHQVAEAHKPYQPVWYQQQQNGGDAEYDPK